MRSQLGRMRVPRTAIAFVSALGLLALAGCASGPAAIVNPATVAQFKARLLAPGTARGYVLQSLAGMTIYKSAAKPMVMPTGSLDHICTQLGWPLVLPMPSLRAGLEIGIVDPKRYAVAPTWDEGIEVYPGSEAGTIVTMLRQLAEDCQHFQWTQTVGSRSKLLPAWAAAYSLPGLGNSGLYIKFRIGAPSERQLAFDWGVIRSGRTLIMINDLGSLVTGTADDPLTLQLTRDAWRRYAAAS